MRNAYPAIGHKVIVDFGGMSFELTFIDGERMSFTGQSGTFEGTEETVFYTAVEIRPMVFMVYWKEPNTTNANVVHVQDFEKGIVYTNISMPDQSFTNLKGSIRIVR